MIALRNILLPTAYFLLRINTLTSYNTGRIAKSQPDLAQFALDILAVPPISDECEQLFSSCKILLED